MFKFIFCITCFRSMELNKKVTEKQKVNATLLLCGLLHNRDTIVAYYASWKAISPSKLVSNGYISNHNKGDAHT